jgi:hypothetical protein
MRLVRKHVYNYNRLFKAADHIHVGVGTCTVYMYTGEGALYIKIFTQNRFEECVREETAHGN